MQQDILIQISQHIKERRRQKNITVQGLADKAGVSKGLISQIENSRTIPSLLVLINIIQALDIDLNVFFKDISASKQQPSVLVKRKGDYSHFEKEDAAGFHYHRIFTRSIKNSAVDFVLLELDVDASRPMVKTEAFEYKYIIAGKVDYQFKNEVIHLNTGDSMLFDGRLPHTPRNTGAEKAIILVVYFFEEEN
ncbi:helix-turn-helix domain-containing protein [Parapedobacter tibetensis]|uniref:helix-turn-helix domain-containing protein n=1 Tax=Parapedobacter tibetensis TaxID=2972951 RepID=UPI00214D8529|nr:XRE family transcriptional regulator [Parapedobacter tibetensis]